MRCRSTSRYVKLSPALPELPPKPHKNRGALRAEGTRAPLKPEGRRERQTDRQTDRQPASQPASQPGRQAGRQAGRQTDRQTDRQRERERNKEKRERGMGLDPTRRIWDLGFPRPTRDPDQQRWAHSLQLWVLSWLPESVAIYLVDWQHQDIRKRGIKKEKEKVRAG